MDRQFRYERREIEQDLLELHQRTSRKRAFETVLKLYFLFGIVTAILAFAYFAISTLDIELTGNQQIALLIAATGAALSVASWLVLAVRRDRAEEDVQAFFETQSLADFITKWAHFEELGKEVLARKGFKFHKYSIREVIEGLHSTGTLSEGEIAVLVDAMQARNLAVHRGDSIPKEWLVRYTSHLGDVIAKLENILVE